MLIKTMDEHPLTSHRNVLNNMPQAGVTSGRQDKLLFLLQVSEFKE